VKQSRKPAVPADNPASSSAGIGEIVQVKVWLLGISPMVWRRVLVPESCTLRELHGVLQVAMGWEGIHLYQFSLRAAPNSHAATDTSDCSMLYYVVMAVNSNDLLGRRSIHFLAT